VHPTRRALAIVSIGIAFAVIPVLISPALWIIWIAAWAALLVALLVDILRLPSLADLRLRVEPPPTLYMGEASPLRLHLTWDTVPSGRPIPVDIALAMTGPLTAPALSRSALSETETRVDLPLTPRRRGRTRLESAWIRWRGPLGLIERMGEVPLLRDVDATPNLRAVRQLAADFASNNELRQGLRIERYLGDGTEFDSLREFMPGFDRRSIDWKSSARHTRLLSRHYRAERDRQVVLAVDVGHLMAEPLEGLPRLDHAIHSSLLLALMSIRSGDRVGLYAFGDRPRAFTEPRAGMSAFAALSKVAAGLDYGDAETNFTLGLTHLMQRLTRRSLIIVMTDFTDSISAELMVENLNRLAGRHLVLFVSLRDPLLDQMVSAAPDDLMRLQSAVVADSLMREREVVLQRLRLRGIHCLDASPKDVGMQLINRYLEIKRRELIG
jgi:uncharacterized protein (DUF58 family)